MPTARSSGNIHLSQTLSRRTLLRLAAGVAAGAALSACGALKPTPRQQVQLVYQDWRTDWFPPMAQKALDEFHAAHPNIRVFYTPDPVDVETSLQADMQAGIAPDVFAGCCTFFPVLAQKGYTLDLRPYVEADLDPATLADWDAAQYRAFFTRDGRQYGLPKYHGALALYYNKDLFDKYHIDYPTGAWNHADYLEAMKRLTHDQNGDGKTDLWGGMMDICWERLQVHINAWGGHLVDPADSTRCLMAEPEAMQALEWIRARMWDDHVMATFPDVQNVTTRQAFINGQVAMVEDGSWALKDILEGASFRVGVAPMPAGPVRRVTLATTDGFGIYAGTRHPEAAWELLKFLVGKSYGRAMIDANLLQPARASLVQEWVDCIRQEYPDQTRDMDLAAFADGHIKGYSVTAEIFEQQEIATQLANSAWHQIFTLGQMPLSQLQTVCRQIEAAQR